MSINTARNNYMTFADNKNSKHLNKVSIITCHKDIKKNDT